MTQATGPRKGPWLALVGAVVVLVTVWGLVSWRGRDDSGSGNDDAAAAADSPGTTVEETTTTTLRPYDGWVNPASSQEPWATKTVGYLTFRGNPTRSWYGEGPVPTNPQVLWTYAPNGGMCGRSSDGGVVSTWCGDGWTGNPNVFERDGKTWVSFGGYDYGLHWLDADTGKELVKTFKAQDLAKGSMSTDPDGFPISYKGSRDNNFYVVATDRGPQAQVLYKLNAYENGVTKEFAGEKELPSLLGALKGKFAQAQPWGKDELEKALRALAEEKGVKAGALIHPVRMAVTASKVGPGLFDVLEAMGKEATFKHLNAFMAALRGSGSV